MDNSMIETDAIGSTPIDYKFDEVNAITDYCGDKDEYKFQERRDLQINVNLEYKREGKYPGYILIFNQEEFVKHTFRKGSRTDVNNIIECFSKCGYNINRKDNIHNNLDTKGIIAVLDNVVNKDLSEYNSMIIFFLSHGTVNNVLNSRDSVISSDIIIDKIASCKQLQNKPKWFVFQACRSKEGTPDLSEEECASKIVPETTFSNHYIYKPDIAILYASVEDYKAFRHLVLGSWLIQELCKNILAYGRREDVTSIIMRTTKCVSSNYFYENKKQIPLFISTLTKKFYLNRSKDRSFLVEQEKTSENIIKMIENLEKNIKHLQIKKYGKK